MSDTGITTEPFMPPDDEPSNDGAVPETAASPARRWVWLLLATVVIAAVAVVVLASGSESDATATTAVELNFGEAIVTDLVQTESFDGTLGTVDGDPLASQFSGTVTNAVAVGEIAEQGDVVFEIDGEPVVLLFGSTPAYRDLAIGVESVTVAASLSGTVTDVAAPGTAVQQGDIIFEISNEPSELDLLQRQQQIDSATSQVASANASYQRLTEEADTADVLAAEASVVQARAALERMLEPPTDAELANAQAQVASAQANLDALLADPSDEEIAAAEAAVASATANVENADRSVDSAYTSLVIALDSYCLHPDQPAGFVCPDGPLSSSERAAITQLIQDEPTGPLVTVAQNLLGADGSYRSATDQLASAQAGLDSAEERLAALYEPASSAAVLSAEASVTTAEENLASLLEGPTEADILQAEANVASAEANLSDLLAGTSSADLSQAWAALENARTSLEIATLQEAELPTGTVKTVLLYGDFPAWRALGVASAPGPDVAQLEQNLSLLGYDPDGLMILDDIFDEATARAVERWQETLGVEVTGRVDEGEVVFVSGPAQVGTAASVGDSVGSGVAAVTLITGETMVGSDVEQLESALYDLGYDPGPVDGTFTDETRVAVIEWQTATGLEPDGIVNLGEIIFLEGAIQVSDQLSPVGTRINAGAPILAVSSSEKVVRLNLPARNQGVVSVGDEVIIVMPDFSETPGVVTSVAATATVDQGNQAVFEVIVELADPAVATGLDEAPVEVDVITESVEAVLAVPVASLVALSEGGYAVRLEAGTGDPRLVAVEPGFFADGYVEVTETEIESGDRVVVP